MQIHAGIYLPNSNPNLDPLTSKTRQSHSPTHAHDYIASVDSDSCESTLTYYAYDLLLQNLSKQIRRQVPNIIKFKSSDTSSRCSNIHPNFSHQSCKIRGAATGALWWPWLFHFCQRAFLIFLGIFIIYLFEVNSKGTILRINMLDNLHVEYSNNAGTRMWTKMKEKDTSIALTLKCTYLLQSHDHKDDLNA